MAPDSEDLLTADEASRLDALYHPFPSFGDWSVQIRDEVAWETIRGQIDARRSAGVPDETLQTAIEVAVRAAALETGAIEGLYSTNRGLTMTVATQSLLWDEKLREQADRLEFFEAQLEAYEHVLDAATERRPLTEHWVRSVHEELCRPQETYVVQTALGPQRAALPKGVYKDHPNHVLGEDGEAHAYAPVNEVAPEMGRLVAELSSGAFASAHPVVQAAYAHYAFVAIHPFADGNGRVARALGSVFLYRAASIPYIVFSDEKRPYFDALAAADKGDFAAFVSFTEETSKTAMTLVIESVLTSALPPPEDSLRRLRELTLAQGQVTHVELDHAAAALSARATEIIEERFLALPVADGVTWSAQWQAGTGSPPGTFRPLVDPPSKTFFARVTNPPPAAAQVDFRLDVFASASKEVGGATALIVSPWGFANIFELSEVWPRPSHAAEQRLTLLADRVIRALLADLATQAEADLRSRGYAS